jgi:Skp family chaperone for outer membrane proteins
VRKIFLLVVFSISLAAAPLQQVAGQNRPGTTIALLDIEEVFQNYKRYKAMLDDVRKDEQALDTFVRGKAKELNTMQVELRDYKPGTANYSQLEKRIATLKAETTVEAELKRKDFIIRRSKASHAAYQDITRTVARFAESNGINLVMAYDKREVDPTNPNQVLTEINRRVVYQRSLNITKYIIEQLNTGVPPAEVSNRPGVPVRPGSR